MIRMPLVLVLLALALGIASVSCQSYARDVDPSRSKLDRPRERRYSEGLFEARKPFKFVERLCGDVFIAPRTDLIGGREWDLMRQHDIISLSKGGAFLPICAVDKSFMTYVPIPSTFTDTPSVISPNGRYVAYCHVVASDSPCHYHSDHERVQGEIDLYVVVIDFVTGVTLLNWPIQTDVLSLTWSAKGNLYFTDHQRLYNQPKEEKRTLRARVVRYDGTTQKAEELFESKNEVIQSIDVSCDERWLLTKERSFGMEPDQAWLTDLRMMKSQRIDFDGCVMLSYLSSDGNKIVFSKLGGGVYQASEDRRWAVKRLDPPRDPWLIFPNRQQDRLLYSQTNMVNLRDKDGKIREVMAAKTGCVLTPVVWSPASRYAAGFVSTSWGESLHHLFASDFDRNEICFYRDGYKGAIDMITDPAAIAEIRGRYRNYADIRKILVDIGYKGVYWDTLYGLPGEIK